ncbi:MAG TPA: histidine kinase [Nocardioides sp.]|nr:histidine kinase [Nocardioides sp.]
MTLLPRTPLARDLALGAVVTAIAELELLLNAGSVSGTIAWHAMAYLLILPALALRRRVPLASAALAGVSLALEPLIGPAQVATPYLALLFLLVSLGWYASWRVGAVGLALVLGGGIVYDLTRRDFLLADLVVNVVIIVAMWMAGRLLRVTTDRRVRSELAAERAAAAAVEAERARIAGDLHDSLAHALTLITLQAGSARERTEEPVAADALTSIEQTGRDALADMQRFLALLGPGSPDAPGIGDLRGLVESVRAGGLDVELDTEPGKVTPGVSTTVFRVVQEALTNVVRHSNARAARVAVHRDGGVLVTRISDDGETVDARTPGTGRGLSGLADRVRAFDGTVTSGRTADGWQVEARIPVAESPA